MTSIPFSADASGAELRPIGAYGMLADGSTAALVSDQGSVDWLCFPRFDAPALFARILDPAAGHWSIRPLNVIRHHRRYLPGTLVIETTFTTSTGSVTVTDALAVAHGQRGHDLGLAAPHRLLRVVRGRLGQVTMLMEFAPRPAYGLVSPQILAVADGLRIHAGPHQIALSAGVALMIDGATASGGFSVAADESVGFCLDWAPSGSRPPQPCAPSDVDARRIPVALPT